MAVNTKIITLGGSILKLNDVDVGHLNGAVQLNYTGESVDFMSANKLNLTRRFRSSERVTLTAQIAELSAANMRLAMGQTTANITSNSYPAFDPSSYTIVSGTSYDLMKFGGDTSVVEVSLQFVHTRPKDSAGLQEVIVIVLYARGARERPSGILEAFAWTAIPIVILSIVSTAGAAVGEVSGSAFWRGFYLVWYGAAGVWLVVTGAALRAGTL